MEPATLVHRPEGHLALHFKDGRSRLTIIVGATCPGRAPMINLEDAVLSAGLVLFGFLITLVWENRKARRREIEERQRVVVAIWLEMMDNAAVCLELADGLRSGRIKGAVIIPPLKVQAWTLASWNWPLLRFREDEARILLDISWLVDRMNATIRAREGFLVSMVALTSYERTIDQLNDSLREKAEEYATQYEKLHAALRGYQSREGLSILPHEPSKGK